MMFEWNLSLWMKVTVLDEIIEIIETKLLEILKLLDKTKQNWTKI